MPSGTVKKKQTQNYISQTPLQLELCEYGSPNPQTVGWDLGGENKKAKGSKSAFFATVSAVEPESKFGASFFFFLADLA